jgi:hypothetical protein
MTLAEILATFLAIIVDGPTVLIASQIASNGTSSTRLVRDNYGSVVSPRRRERRRWPKLR